MKPIDINKEDKALNRNIGRGGFVGCFSKRT